MPGKWKRPELVPYPSIWRRFEGRTEINGRIPKFWVQDIPEEMFEEAIDIMCSNFIYEEPLCRYSGLANDPESVQEMKQKWQMLLTDKMALICFMENPDPNGKPIIAGLNMTYIRQKDDATPRYQTKQWAKFSDTARYVCQKRDAFSHLGIERYLSEIGLSVLPEYRGQGVGLEILLARDELCRATGIVATLTVFTAIASQKLAVKAGFQDFIQMSYDDIAKKDPRFEYPGINEHTKNIRYMFKIIQ